MQAVVAEKLCRIEFSYRRREGKAPSLARNSPIRGISCCAIFIEGGPCAVAAAVCAAGDNWNRARGRKEAFMRAVLECGILSPLATEFATWFGERFPERVAVRKPKFALSLEEIARRREEGRARKAAGGDISSLSVVKRIQG